MIYVDIFAHVISADTFLCYVCLWLWRNGWDSEFYFKGICKLHIPLVYTQICINHGHVLLLYSSRGHGLDAANPIIYLYRL